jgi:hypothetical protein
MDPGIVGWPHTAPTPKSRYAQPDCGARETSFDPDGAEAGLEIKAEAGLETGAEPPPRNKSASDIGESAATGLGEAAGLGGAEIET